MRGLHRFVILASAVSLLTGLGEARAQEAAGSPPDTVIEVRVEGNKHLSTSAVMRHVKIRTNTPYNEEAVSAAQRRLLKTHRFDNVLVEKVQTDKGVILVFRVSERPVIRAVEFVGAKAVKAKKLNKLIPFGSGDPVDVYRIISAARAIESHYRSEGFRYAKVTTDNDALTNQQKVVFHIVEGPRSYVRKVRYKGNESFSRRKLNRTVKTSSRIWIFRSGVLDTETVERDVVDLRNFYRGKGFLDAEVGWTATDTPDKKKVDITFVIDEGPHYRVRRILFPGATVFAPAELTKDLQLSRGKFYDADTVEIDLKKIRDLYGEIGYIDASAVSSTSYVAPGAPTPDWLRPAPDEKVAMIDLVYTIKESGQFKVGRVDIRGNSVTKMNVIRRQVSLIPGQIYDSVAAARSRRQLMETGLFQDVTILPYGDELGVRHAVVRVAEGNTANFAIGAGFSSNVGLLGDISFTENNFDIFNLRGRRGGRPFRGGGQFFQISAQPGVERMRFSVSWREPYLFNKPNSLGVKLYAQTAERETWDESRYGSVVSLGHMFKNRWYGQVAGRLEGVQVDSLDSKAPPDVISDKGTTLLTSVQGMVVRDRRDSRWLPGKGDRIEFSYEQVVGGANFGRVRAEYRKYYTLRKDALDRPHILAYRAAGGAIVGEAPVFERFYGGGIGAVRGFKFRGISPRQGPTAEVVGGDVMAFLGSEYSFPLVGKNLRGVVFLDTGTVEDGFGVSDYRASAGFGVRFHVPMLKRIPMSLDFGFPLSKNSDDDTELVSFSIGVTF